MAGVVQYARCSVVWYGIAWCSSSIRIHIYLFDEKRGMCRGETRVFDMRGSDELVWSDMMCSPSVYA